MTPPAPPTPCRCGCDDPRGSAVHVVANALAVDDLDRAIEAGLLGIAPCPACTVECAASVATARDNRRGALAARERYRAREARLARRAAEREARRAPRPAPATTGTPGAPALPPAAAAALARAKAKASRSRAP